MKKTISAIMACAMLVTGTAFVQTNIFSNSYSVTAQAEDGTLELEIGESRKLGFNGTSEVPKFTSSNTRIATVDADGTVTAVDEGTCHVYAEFSNQTLDCTIIVKKPQPATETQNDFDLGNASLSNDNPSVVIDIAQEYLSKAVWSSSDESVAVVDNTGKVTAKGSGSCIITFVVDGKNYHIKVTSTYNPEQQSTTESAEIHENLGVAELSSSKPAVQYNPVSGTVSEPIVWSSSDESVATVNQDGLITAVGAGECIVTARIGKSTYTITVKSTYVPQAVTEPTTQPKEFIIGETTLSNDERSKIITLSGVPEGTVITWKSTDENVAKVSQDGTVTASGAGNCEIIAVIDGVDYITKVTSTYIPKVNGGVYGDANLDGEVTINDAVAIMSYVANPDKYPIKPQGMDNADVNSRGDGISNMDALSVQKYLANMIEKLPEM